MRRLLIRAANVVRRLLGHPLENPYMPRTYRAALYRPHGPLSSVYQDATRPPVQPGVKSSG